MIRWPAFVVALALVVSGCTQKLTTPADCPALCPGGQSAFRDTIIDAVIGADASYSGYSGLLDATSLLLSNGGGYGESRAAVKFLRVGDSILVRDTMRSYTIDSVQILLALQARDTTVNDVVLELYRLPRTIDSLADFATVDAAMTPANLLGEIAVPNGVKSGGQRLTLTGADLARIAFAPIDSTELVLGVRLRAPAPAGVRVTSLLGGTESPLFSTYVTVNIADTAVRKQLINRNPSQNVTVRSPPAPLGPGILQVGGLPAARSFVRFTLPSYIKDSAQIVRATLELTLAQPLFGIPGDSAFFDVRQVLADFGPKSPVASNVIGSATIKPGASTIDVEMVSVVATWQGATPLPSIIRFGIGQEGSTFLTPLVFSTAATSGRPRLHLTYRLPFAFEGF
ncbi:MAG: hypothetical protein ABJC19_01290 [Gemmatimonadota bacterium]